MSKLPNITYFKYGKIGHKAYACMSNKFVGINSKKIWILKGTIVTNSKRSMLAWVPKIKI